VAAACAAILRALHCTREQQTGNEITASFDHLVGADE
jgi:hypothetical protein